jgi:putative ABC transport system permease protein
LEGERTAALKEPFSIVLTQSLAQQLFGDEDGFGKTIRTGGGTDLKVTGIMQDLPDNSHLNFDALMSLETNASLARANQPPGATQPIWLESWDLIAMPTYIILKDGVSPAGLNEKFTQLCRKHDVEKNFDITIEPLDNVHLYSSDVIFETATHKGDIKTVYIFAAVAFLILLIAVINYMNLSTAKSANRAKEVGIRKVVGSVKSQLVLQFLTESILLTLVALILAIPLADLALPWLNQLIGGTITFNLTQNGSLIIFLISALIAVGLLAGLYPAFVLSGFKPVTVLKGNFKSGRSGTALRKGLVVFQFALSIALIGLTVVVQKQMYFVQHKNMGYDREQVIVFDMNDQRMGQSLETYRKILAGDPNFVNAAASSNVPGRTFGRTNVRPEGASDEDIYIWNTFSVSPETVPVLGMEIAQGRNFSREMGGDTSGVVLINETAVRQLGWDDPLNKRIYIGDNDSIGVAVVGVVKDFHFLGLHQPIEPVIIRPIRGYPGNLIAARIQKGQIPEALKFAEEKWREIYPEYPFAYSFLDDEFDNLYRTDLNTGKIVNIFSVLAIFIACMGLFSLSSHSILMRTKEIGVRKVLGASGPKIVKLLVFEFLKWVILANLFAWPLAWYGASKWLDGFAYKVPLDPVIFLVASIIALVIAVLTVLGQSWKAALNNPAKALRYE